DRVVDPAYRHVHRPDGNVQTTHGPLIPAFPYERRAHADERYPYRLVADQFRFHNLSILSASAGKEHPGRRNPCRAQFRLGVGLSGGRHAGGWYHLSLAVHGRLTPGTPDH